jgi:superfamily II DNA/RNA helicase
MEDGIFAAGLQAGDLASAEFSDDLLARCRDAIAQAASGGPATALDVAVLMRQVLRRRSERDGIPYRLLTGAHPGVPANLEIWRKCGTSALPSPGGQLLLEAKPYQPAWLDAHSPVDAAAAATPRACYADLPADPFFTAATMHQAYRTAGQRSATRAAVSMPEGGTLIAELPTGSGKTEIAISLAGVSRGQAVIIVVPTVALAYDFERRFRELHAQRYGRAAHHLAFAWTGDTDGTTRESMRQDLIRGEIPLLATSPESLDRALRNSLLDAAGAGRLAAFVIDEAHLVTQWGYDFRPEFRELATLRQDALRAATEAGQSPAKTLLLSATLGRAELADLSNLFGEPGPVSLVAANMLRPEPDYWIAPWADAAERQARVLEALTYLPRPLILYVTRPEQAKSWDKLIREHGFGRSAVVTGETAGEDRRDVLAGMRAGHRRASRYDLVIATSAFGLGIDYAGIRAIVHACLPETVGRWYQEVGRAGRDGNASVAVLVPGAHDTRVAASLSVTTLTGETASQRWQDLWASRQETAEGFVVDLQHAPPGKTAGSYNYKWNFQLLRALEDLGHISRRVISPWEAERLGLTWSPNDHHWEQVELLGDEIHAPGFFGRVWEHWRDQAAGPVADAFARMREILRPGTSVCTVVSQFYAPDERIWEVFGPAAATLEPEAGCGRCPGCRALRIAPQARTPPSPGGVWKADNPPTGTLTRLLTACPSAPGAAVLTDEEPFARVLSLAPLLWEAGVRYFAGVRDWEPRRGQWAFIDESLAHPDEAPPVPGFVIPLPDALATGQWLFPGARQHDMHGHPSPLIMLVRPSARIGGRPIRLFPTLSAATAERILKARPT